MQKYMTNISTDQQGKQPNRVIKSSYKAFIIVFIIITTVIIMLELHTEWVLDQWLNFLRFFVSKTPQTLITSWRILAEFITVVLFYFIFLLFKFLFLFLSNLQHNCYILKK